MTSKPQKAKRPFEHHMMLKRPFRRKASHTAETAFSAKRLFEHHVMLKRPFRLLHRARKEVNAADGEKAVRASCDAEMAFSDASEKSI
jgi:hypothetical protein